MPVGSMGSILSVIGGLTRVRLACESFGCGSWPRGNGTAGPRFQAWNSVGRSEYGLIHGREAMVSLP